MNGRHALLALAVLLATAAIVFGLGPLTALQVATPDGTVLDTEPRPAEAALRWLRELSPTARGLYGEHLWWDAAFLVVHAGALFVLLRVGAARVGHRWLRVAGGVAAWLALVAGALDALENALLAALLAAPTDTAATALGVATTAKLALVTVLLPCVVSLWALVAVRALRSSAHARVRTRQGAVAVRARA